MTRTTNFVWDAVNDIVLSELDGTNTVTATYTNEPQQYGYVVSQRRGTTSHTLHADALGTTRLVTTAAQATSDTYLYDAWGNLITSTGSTVNPFRWVGKFGYYQDSSTGLVYVRARIYQPTVARWESVDPFDLRDHYSYGHNAPLVHYDRSGLLCENIIIPNCGLDDSQPPQMSFEVLHYPQIPNATIPYIPFTNIRWSCTPGYSLVPDIGQKSRCVKCRGICDDKSGCIPTLFDIRPGGVVILSDPVCDCADPNNDRCAIIASRTAGKRGECPWPMELVRGTPVSYCILCEGYCKAGTDKGCYPYIEVNPDPKKRGTPNCGCGRIELA